MNNLLIKNGNAIIDGGIVNTDILIKDGVIVDTSFEGKVPDGCKIIDADGKYVSAGFIDLHVHGGGGYDFMDCTEEAFESISRTHLYNGTTTMLPLHGMHLEQLIGKQYQKSQLGEIDHH